MGYLGPCHSFCSFVPFLILGFSPQLLLLCFSIFGYLFVSFGGYYFPRVSMSPANAALDSRIPASRVPLGHQN